MMTKEQMKEFDELTEPLVRWINENGNPSSMIVIDWDSAKFYKGAFNTPQSL